MFNGENRGQRELEHVCLYMLLLPYVDALIIKNDNVLVIFKDYFDPKLEEESIVFKKSGYVEKGLPDPFEHQLS